MLSRNIIARWVGSFWKCVGAISIATGLIAAMYPDLFSPKGWVYLLVISVIAILYASYNAWPRNCYTIHYSHPDTSISILIGDLFKQDGHLVIGMSDTFDTEVPIIIKKNSIQGQFLEKIFNNDVSLLDKELKQALNGIDIKEIVSDNNKKKGKNKRYPIGTVAALGKGNTFYFCVAYSHMDSNNCAQSSPCDLWNSLDNLWDAIRVHGQQEQVSIAVVGSDLARLTNRLSRDELIKFIILSYLSASRHRPITKRLQIIIHPKDINNTNIVSLAEYVNYFS
ncbi:TPA: hypothetical protein JBD08_12470 [Legionella pneumophila subsp. pneumophila]|nr:hypothetical protein [Legionella pneumophila subsp. pneumophila]HCC3234325.1 hypothetical protein [Legionella pneumophila subsp. pneumophila]